jgi:hypothetical protein
MLTEPFADDCEKGLEPADLAAMPAPWVFTLTSSDG